MDKPWLAHYEAHVPAEITIPPTPLAECLRHNAQRWPDQPALIFFDRKVPYRALNQAVDRCAAALQRLGVTKGDRVALILPNCPQYVIAFYAALRVGAIAVPCNPLHVARELERQLVDAGARVAVALSLFYPTVQTVRARTALEHVLVANIKDYFPPALKAAFSLLKEKQQGHALDLSTEPATSWFHDALREAPPLPAPVRVELDDTACLIYTGGATGTPKGAELTQRNLLANAIQCHAWLNTQMASEVVLAALPLSHSYGMTVCMNHGIYVAATVVLAPNPRDLRFVLSNVQKHRPTFFPGMPTLYVAINHYAEVGRYDLSSIRACISGGAGLPREVQARFQELTGGRLVEGYGLSEASPVTHANPIGGENRSGTIGLPWPSTECKLVDLESGAQPAAPGQPGELCVRGPQVMKGYWRKPAEMAQVLRDGWLHTGDVAVMDADGYFTLVDRKTDLIIAGGLNVYPREIEEVLYEHPKVQEAVAVGIPHPYRGETVKAYVQLKAGQVATEEELLRWCRGRLAKYKVPTAVAFRAELPMSAVGKVLRQALREEELARLGVEARMQR